MLYYFPDESPEDLDKMKAEYLEKEIQRANYVETHGYRRKEPSLPNFYAEWHCIQNYLKCPIVKWKYPVSSKDKVELEPIPSDFLPPMWTLKKLKFFDPESQEYVRRIVGFREIQKKREYIEYLKEIEEEIENVNGRGRSGEEIQIEIENEGQDDTQNDDQGMEKHLEETDPCTLNKIQPFLRIARGGGKKDKGGKETREKDKRSKDTLNKGKDKQKDKKDKNDAVGTQESGVLSKFFSLFSKDDGKAEADKSKGKKGKGGAKDDKKRKKNEARKRKKEANDDVEHQKWGLASIWKDKGKTTKALEKEHRHNLEQIFKYHGLFRVRAAKERDSEWLELSFTDPEETEKEIKSFGKPKTGWMIEGISFESQYLTRSLRLYNFFSAITGRSFFRVRPDANKGHMDFTHKKKDVILFFMTSIFFWICFCLITISFLDIQLENQIDVELPVGPGSNKTIDHLLTQANIAKHEVEELQLTLYEVPLYALLINIVLVSVWSIFVILGDGIFITHYINCWCAALAEMETSGCLKIQRKIINYHVEFFLYAVLVAVLFYFDYPKHIRQSNILISAMIMRPLYPYLRIDSDEKLLPYQIGGMIFQLYVIYCAVLIKLLMSVLASILKNASEMWNFKFALAFQQLATKNRGQLLRLGLNHSLLKLFTHHRILTVLLRSYGEVFSTPVMMSMICEMGVFTITLVRWFFYKAEEIEEAYKGNEYVVIRTQLSLPKKSETIKIPYFHSKAENHLIFYFMMGQVLFQFLNTLDCLAKAGDSFFAGYEFVRRSGTILCRNSHQRRLIQSLEWSFSSTNPSVLSANSFYAINRATILSSFAAVAGFFSLIIQLQVQAEYPNIKFNEVADCQFFGQELDRGSCVVKKRESDDASVIFNSLVGNPRTGR